MCGKHQFSAFVDDSTVFFARSAQVPRVLKIGRRFGQLSGLHMQPSKNKFIFLNAGNTPFEWYGILVLQPGDTATYLGYEVGNWTKCVRSIKRRFLRLRNPPQLRRDYTWKVAAPQEVIGSTEDSEATITLVQQVNGIYWTVGQHRIAKRDAISLATYPGE
ncbi:RxLR effector protein [Phytophthora megakarya]|uniref:RxLR effector protein n=1 Tax=Phytophthora megakarya TaxID=4795 RepID=A0A225X275_9STRA|nr:RxLR effector protein [Phytophthora megakarya]